MIYVSHSNTRQGARDYIRKRPRTPGGGQAWCWFVYATEVEDQGCRTTDHEIYDRDMVPHRLVRDALEAFRKTPASSAA